jgi:hypothetical protein
MIKRGILLSIFITTCVITYSLYSDDWCEFERPNEALETANRLFYELNLDHKVQTELNMSIAPEFTFRLERLWETSHQYSASVIVTIQEQSDFKRLFTIQSGCLGQAQFETVE